MRLTIFGATGGTGTQVVRQALDAQHEVRAVVRDPARLTVPTRTGLEMIRADVMDPEAIVAAVQGADAVVSALGPHGTGPTSVCTDGVRSIIQAMDKSGLRRLIAVSASGAFTDEGDGPITRLIAKPILQWVLRHNFADLRTMEREVRASATEWTIMRPPRLTDARRQGSYRTAVDRNVRGGFQISRADLAAEILRTIADPGTVRHTVGVAY